MATGCAHCGRQEIALKRCSNCKQDSYCGAECQKAGWKRHKKKCVTLRDAQEKVQAAHLDNDWREVLKWEGRMEETMEGKSDAVCSNVLHVFAQAHALGFNSTFNSDHALSIVHLDSRRVEVLGKMQRFRDQGDTMCTVADHLLFLGLLPQATDYFQRARRVGEDHGFFSVECKSCLGLGKLAVAEGRDDEGVGMQTGLEFLRNALVCAPLSEGDASTLELEVLQAFINALFFTHAIDEVEPLVARYREAAKAGSEKEGRMSLYDLHSLYTSARLHEVLASAPPLHLTLADGICCRSR